MNIDYRIINHVARHPLKYWLLCICIWTVGIALWVLAALMYFMVHYAWGMMATHSGFSTFS